MPAVDDEPSTSRLPEPARIVIADDHPIVREELRGLLKGWAGIEVVGEAADGLEALKLCRRLRPDLVLMDVRMPGMDGLEATRQIKEEFPRTIVLILTAHADQNYLMEALKAGAAGYILKHQTRKEQIDAIRRVLVGESPLDQELATKLLLRLIEETSKQRPPTAAVAEGPSEERSAEVTLVGALTPREMDVLKLLAKGRTNREICGELYIGMSTVKKHVQNVISKLGVSDRTQGAVRAIELGLLSKREGR